MACNKPFLRRCKGFNGLIKYLPTPCGYCAACRRDKINMWSDRIRFAADTDSRPSTFFTLTYKDEKLPAAGVQLDDVQRFVKRLRYFTPHKFKYYIVSEYGDEPVSGSVPYRAHYHGCLIGFDPEKDAMAFYKAWSDPETSDMGYSSCDYLNPTRIRYTLKYLAKEMTSSNQEEYISHGLNPLFHVMSKGIGRDWFFRPFGFYPRTSWLLRFWKASPLAALLRRFIARFRE